MGKEISHVTEMLNHVRHYLTAQGPIKDFIHHNTLHAFQDLPFDEAIVQASWLYGTQTLMPLSFYQKARDEGLIDDDALSEARARITNKDKTELKAPFVKMRASIEAELGCAWDAEINPILFRVVSGFLDQGISLWAFPAREKPFYEALRALVSQSIFSLAPFARQKSLETWLSQEPEEAVEKLLSLIVGDSALYESYMIETLLAHAGWSGMVSIIEEKPDALMHERRIRLMELLAFKLILEWAFIENSGIQLQNKMQPQGPAIKVPTELQIWHEAFEMSCYRRLLLPFKEKKGSTEQQTPHAQAIFCIDDRECSFRRHLEAVDPGIETFGWAGFFGLDFAFQSLNDAVPVPMCPPMVKPKFTVKERPHKDHEKSFLQQKELSKKSALSFELWREATSSMLLGFLAASTLGHLSLLRLLSSFLRPQEFLKSLKSKRIEVPTTIRVLKEEAGDEGLTAIEMADRVESVLVGMGLTETFASMIYVIAHGSSSVNNPHFAAYDCGACAGKPGAPNARVFAHMANLREVRSVLATRGLVIPDQSRFVGGFHDTATDAVVLFDTDDVSADQRVQISAFEASLVEVRFRNAKERCKRFDLVRPDVSNEEALHEVMKRAVSLFEPRPELGHATNVSCIVGPRSLTRGMFMDRRAFMNSYEPLQDPDGVVLTQILNAAIPVCAGINLEYLFSRVDPAIYGCGTKLSHNVVSLLGVCNGTDDDLRTGLPVQMTELHDPIRLLVIVQQRAAVIEKVLEQNKGLGIWVEKEWVRLVSLDPQSNALLFYRPEEGFVAL